MTKPQKIVQILVLCLIMTGCGTYTIKFNPDTDRKSLNNYQRHPVYDLEKLPVSVDPKLMTVSATHEVYQGVVFKYEIGNLLQRIFVISDAAPVRLDLISSELIIKSHGDLFDPCGEDATYNLTVKLSSPENIEKEVFVGNGCSVDPYFSGQKAVEKTVYKLYKVVESKLNNKDSTTLK